MTTSTTTYNNSYNDIGVKLMIYPSVFFLVMGMTFGVYLAYNAYVFPDYFSGEYVHFGRVRPVHVSHVTLLWLLSANVGLMYYFIPRLCGVSLWSPKMACLSAALWWLSLPLMVYSFPFGTNSGWEYAELPSTLGWLPTKLLFVTAWLLVVLNLSMTIATRRFQKMYVSIWYVMGTMLWTTFTVVVGFYAIWWVPGGISRVNVNYFYVHNLVGLIFTPMGLATAYYFLPKLANRPIYSHKLSMIGFWTIAFTYAWIGSHHIIHGPMSQWLQTLSIVFSIWLFIPVWTVVTNLAYTLSGQWHKYEESAAIRFIMMGVMFYLITCIQGPLMALRNINEITSKTDWVIGHSHISLYATFTFFAIAGIYYAVPSVCGKPLWSKRMADWHFTLNMVGSFPFLLALWLGGFLRGMLWASWADGSTYAQYHANLAALPFLDTVAEMWPWWVLRAVGGTIILAANILFAVNIFNTIILKNDEQRQPAAGKGVL